MNKSGQNNVCAVIPAAGRSTRMKSFKPLLTFDKERNFIEKIVDEFLEFGCSEIIVVVNEKLYNNPWIKVLSERASKVSVIINNKLEFERFYSIKLGLNKLRTKKYCFIHNCDNPFINQEIITTVFENKISDGYVSPIYNNQGGHPILISEPIIKSIIHSTENDSNFKDVINLFPCRKVNIDTKDILTNINTESQYHQLVDFKQLLSK
nr:NTP transferase domain-containing protein [Bacteroidota bacterium]